MRIHRVAAAVVCLCLSTPAAAQFASEQDRRMALQYYRAGQELMSAEQFEKAAAAFQRAIDADRLLTLAHYGLGQANMELKRFASAIQAFLGCRSAFRSLHDLGEVDRVSVERQRDDEIRELKETVRRMRADARTNQPGQVTRLEDRVRDLERQRTSISPVFQSPAELSLALGSAYFRSDSQDDALREWKAAVDVNPKLGEAHNNLAVLHMLQGRKQEAEAAIKAAERAGFRINPNLKADIKRMPS